jgi:hypothetical protein
MIAGGSFSGLCGAEITLLRSCWVRMPPESEPTIRTMTLGERDDSHLAMVPDLYLPGTLPWHAFRAILQSWPDALQSSWPKVAAAYVDAHFVACRAVPEPFIRRRRYDLTQALLNEIGDLAAGGWA